MKLHLTYTLNGFYLLLLILLAGCQKEEIAKPDRYITPRTEHECCVNSLPSASELVYTGTHGITVWAYNDATTTYVTITRATGVMTVRYRQPGVCPNPSNGPTVCEGCTSWSTSFPNPAGWECGDPVTFSFYLNGLGGPPPNTHQTCVITYNLKDVCEVCTNSLTAEVNCDTDENGCNRHVTFTFTAEEAGPIVIQGGLTAFTEICSASATGGLVLNPTHPSAGGKSNVTRWEGEVLGDCTEYTITISWKSTNEDPEITGRWSAVRGEVELAFLDPLFCD